MKNQEKYEAYLKQINLSDSTIRSYMWVYNYYSSHYSELNSSNLLSFKEYLTAHYKPQTVNQRIQAVNKYLEFSGLEHLKLQSVKIQQKIFWKMLSVWLTTRILNHV